MDAKIVKIVCVVTSSIFANVVVNVCTHFSVFYPINSRIFLPLRVLP